MPEPNTSRQSAGAATDANPPPATMSGSGMNHLGYRGWAGQLEPGWLRWAVIAGVGVRRAWGSSWLKRMLFLAWLPAIWFGTGFFLWEQAAQYPEWRQMLGPMLRGFPPTPTFDEIRSAVNEGNLEKSRHTVWAWLLQSLFRYPQGVLMVMIMGMVAPPLISQDIRSRAFLVYFSKPLTRSEYITGKLASLWVFLSIVSTAPALVLYVLGVLLSPNLSVIAATWDLPLRIIAASVVLMLPTSVLALCFSSLTTESRYAGFAWFAVWILGWFTYAAVTAATAINSGPRPRFGRRPLPVIDESSWTHLSLYHTLGKVQSWIFGFTDLNDALVPIAILLAITLVSLAVLVRRISAPMRV